MAYNKPQVTIDLDEYNDLKDKIAKTELSDYYKAAQVIAWSALNAGLDGMRFKADLERKGVSIAMRPSLTGTPKPDDFMINIKEI